MKLPVDERKKYVIKLHNEEYTNRQISQELRISSRDIVKILKEHESEEKETQERKAIERKEKEKKSIFLSNRSEALKLYKKGTRPIDVAIELDISAEEAKMFYSEYCSFEYPLQFLELYTELDKTNSFKGFADLFHLIKENGLSVEEGIEGVKLIKDISLLKEEHKGLSKNIVNLKKLQDSLKVDNNFFIVQIEEMEIRLNSILEKIDVKEKIFETISNQVRQKNEEIYKMNSDENYYKYRNRIKLIVEEFLGDRKKVIFLAVSAVVKAIKENHQREIPLKDLPNSVYGYVSDCSDVEIYLEKLQDLAEKVWDSILDECTNDVLNPSSNLLKNQRIII
jgi:hypothetical protein